MIDHHATECDSGDSPTLTLRLQQAGEPWPVNSGYTIALVGEVDPFWGRAVPLSPVAANSANPGANWAMGIVTVTIPAAWTTQAQRVRWALVVTSTSSPNPAVTTDRGVMVVRHQPGATPPA